MVYFRGLSTYHDDGFHIGPLSLGPAYFHLERMFSSFDLEFIPVLGMRSGRVVEKADRAIQYLDRFGLLKERRRFHILAHSTGGLVARAFVHRISNPERVVSLTTLGTPHRGSELAENAFSFSENKPKMYRAFRALGYDSRKKLDFFRDLRPAIVREFNQNYPNLENIVYASVPCHIPFERQAWPIKIIHRMWAEEVFGDVRRAPPSDGLILLSSQLWGRELKTFLIDHNTQIGFLLYTQPRLRQYYRKKFFQLGHYLHRWWEKVESLENEDSNEGIRDSKA